jgi:hypothetical protein
LKNHSIDLFGSKMPAPTSSETKAAILAHHQNGLSCRKIVLALSNLESPPRKTAVNDVIREFKNGSFGLTKPLKRLGNQCLPTKRTPDLIRKVAAITSRANPPTQKQMAVRYGVDRKTIRNVLTKDLGRTLRKKRKTHALSDKQAKQRLDRGPGFLELIGGRKWKYVISLDEAWLSLNDVNGVRGVYYEQPGKKTPESWKKFKKKHEKKVMFAAGVCARGVTGIYFVPPTCKVDRWFFIEHILKPVVEIDIPRLYPKNRKKVILHFDSAGSHTTPEVYAWLDERKVKYIRKEEWLSNSPDLSPMDYGPNGIFKRMMFEKKTKTLAGLMKVAKKVWAAFPLATCYNTMAAWGERVNLMLENMGLQIEHLKK